MRFQILTLSGGGYLGLFTARILAGLEQQAGRPLGQCFDLIAGTSIGGITALALSREVPAVTVVEQFSKNGAAIFSNRKKPKGPVSAFKDLCRFVFSPKYDGSALRKVCVEILGEETLLGDAKHRLLVPTINMTKGSVQMLKTPHHPNFVRDHTLRMVDVALATSAAPTFFPLAEIGDSLCADGGLVANAPDLCALHEATHFLETSEADVHILSIGTTTSGFSLSHQTGTAFGSYKWLRGHRLFSTMISAQQQLSSYILTHRLQERYFRVDAMQSPEQQAELGLDVATEAATKTIRGMGDGAYQKIASDERIKQMLVHEPRKPTFHHGSQR